MPGPLRKCVNSSPVSKPYLGYFFDLDGTLIDTAPDLNQAQNAALSAFGYKAASESLTRHWVGHGSRVLLQKALAHQHAAEDNLDALQGYFLDYYANHIAVHSAPYPGVVQTLTTLRNQGAKLAVVTNKVERLSQKLLKDIGLADHFDLVVGGDTAAKNKPSADPALYACGNLDLAPADVLFVGDSTTDVGCARAAGCPVVCVSYGYNQGVDPRDLGADHVIDSFLDLV